MKLGRQFGFWNLLRFIDSIASSLATHHLQVATPREVCTTHTHHTPKIICRILRRDLESAACTCATSSGHCDTWGCVGCCLHLCAPFRLIPDSSKMWSLKREVSYLLDNLHNAWVWLPLIMFQQNELSGHSLWGRIPPINHSPFFFKKPG